MRHGDSCSSSTSGPTRAARGWSWPKSAVAAGSLALMMSVVAYLVDPSGDDWATSAPIFRPAWNLFAPGLFWRPFDQLTRVVLGLRPSLVPVLPHTLALAGQALASWSLYRIVASRRSQRDPAPMVAVGLFWVWPAAAAAVLSVDTASQTCSTGLGLLATYLLVRARASCPLVWLVPALVGTLWKESGVAWLVAAPLLAAAVDPKPMDRSRARRLIRTVGVGIGGCALYLLTRAFLANTTSLGESHGRYSLSLHPSVWGTHVAMLGVVAVFPMDTVALFAEPRRLPWFATTCLIGSAFVLATLRRVRRTFSLARVGLVMFAGLALAAPHAVLSHTSELYAHPLSALVLAVGCMAWTEPATRTERWAFVATLLVAIAITACKARAQLEAGWRARQVGSALAACSSRPPGAICPVVVSSRRGYSVFDMDAATASNMGRSAAPHWGWMMPDLAAASAPRDCPDDAAVPIVIFRGDDFSVERCRSSETPVP